MGWHKTIANVEAVDEVTDTPHYACGLKCEASRNGRVTTLARVAWRINNKNKEVKMNLYLASKFALKDWVIYVSNYLVNTGHEITCKWWYDDIKGIKVTDTEWYKHPQVIEVSDRDYKGVDDADALILISDLSAPLSFNGANVELGYAVARNKRIFILGKVDRNALYSRAIFCKDLFELIDALNEYRPKSQRTPLC